MTPRTVVVAHRHAMVAEGIAAGLRDYPSIDPVAVATNAAEGERLAASADAVALDEELAGATSAASRLRRRGIRVVLLGVNSRDVEGVVVSTHARIAVLAEALVPGSPAAPPSLEALTRREREILALVAEGMAGKQVARHLGISAKTVERHKTRMFSKLGVSNQTAAVSLVFGRGSRREGAWSRSNT